MKAEFQSIFCFLRKRGKHELYNVIFEIPIVHDHKPR